MLNFILLVVSVIHSKINLCEIMYFFFHVYTSEDDFLPTFPGAVVAVIV